MKNVLEFLGVVVVEIVAAIVFACAAGVLTALPVTILWNMLIPDLFGLPIISFWQAIGLSMLSALLLKSSSSSGSSK